MNPILRSSGVFRPACGPTRQATCEDSAILTGMADDLPTLRWYHLTPERLVLTLLVIEGLLWLSERFRCSPKGWAVLIAVPSIGIALVLMLVWFAVAVVFRRRFQFSVRSLLVLTIAVALPFSWLT